jgi:site-specific DNA-cytosine methylase
MGKGLNLKDPRSKLFFEFVRLWKECNPKYYLLENVKMKGEPWQIISEFMGIFPLQIDSALVSAQTRHRWYWTDIPNVSKPADKGILFKDVLEPSHEPLSEKVI